MVFPLQKYMPFFLQSKRMDVCVVLFVKSALFVDIPSIIRRVKFV